MLLVNYNWSFQRLFAVFISFFYGSPTSKSHYSFSNVGLPHNEKCRSITNNIFFLRWFSHLLHSRASQLSKLATIALRATWNLKGSMLLVNCQNVKYFAGNLSLFLVVSDVNASVTELNDDLKKINKWVFQWKMSFNPDPSKQAKEVILIHKIKKLPHLFLVFNNINVLQAS